MCGTLKANVSIMKSPSSSAPALYIPEIQRGFSRCTLLQDAAPKRGEERICLVAADVRAARTVSDVQKLSHSGIEVDGK